MVIFIASQSKYTKRQCPNCGLSMSNFRLSLQESMLQDCFSIMDKTSVFPIKSPSPEHFGDQFAPRLCKSAMPIVEGSKLPESLISVRRMSGLKIQRQL